MYRIHLLLATACAGSLAAQAPRDTSKTFLTRRDALHAGMIIASSAAVSIFDERIGRWTRTAGVQGDSSRNDLARHLTVINETPLTLGALAAYGIGRLIGSETLADVGLHATQSLVLTVGAAELIRGPLGRLRPRAAPGDPYHFKLGAGFTNFAARSYPSIHAAVAFATASTLVEELQFRRPGAVKVAAPLLYTAAMIPGLTRMYLDQHWASDVVAGTFMGLMIGNRVVRYAHTHRKSRLDRALLGMAIVPDGRGGIVVAGSMRR